MKMDDEKLKRILQEGMEYEADCIMAEVESDPNMKDVIAPEDLHTNLMKQIYEHEEAKERERENQAKEEQELIRLGKIYKKKRARRKYIVLIAAVVCALGVGTISFGDGKKVIQEVKDMIAGKTQLNIDDNGERTREIKSDSEEETYEEINGKFGFYPVRMLYMPEGMEVAETIIEEEKQSARIYYSDDEGKSISYRIVTNYRTGSVGTDIEDVLIEEYEKEVNGIVISISQYEVEENNTLRWAVKFTYENAQYSLILMGMQEDEVEKIVENLYFS